MKNKDLAIANKIRRAPTVFVYGNDKHHAVEYEGDRKKFSVVNFMQTVIDNGGVVPKPPEPEPEPVEEEKEEAKAPEEADQADAGTGEADEGKT